MFLLKSKYKMKNKLVFLKIKNDKIKNDIIEILTKLNYPYSNNNHKNFEDIQYADNIVIYDDYKEYAKNNLFEKLLIVQTDANNELLEQINICECIQLPILHKEMHIIIENAFNRASLRKRLEKKTYLIKERIKELDCIYKISNIVETKDNVVDILNSIVNIIPESLQYPDIASCKIILDEVVYNSNNYKDGNYKLDNNIYVKGIIKGNIEIIYDIKKTTNINTSPFVIEEKQLLKAIANKIGRIIERKEAEKALFESEQKYKKFYNTALIGLFKYSIKKTKILMINSTGLKIFGIDNNDYDYDYDKSLEILNSYLNNNTKLLKFVTQIMKENYLENYELKIKDINNNEIDILINARYFENEDVIEGIIINISKLIDNHYKHINEKEKKIKSLEKKLGESEFSSYMFENMIGKSYHIKNIFKLIKEMSGTDANVLITGESGTGKELVAHAVHNNSRRKDNVFIPINCATLPENLIESELFGYEQGAFTGAVKKKIGKFEYASSGTLFLDEIAEISPRLQTKLLRVLQDKTLTRIGGNKEIRVDVRIIAATNRDLEKMMKENDFRQDLYYRLNVIPIYIPPLRERKEDIILLAMYFIKRYNSLYNKNINVISKQMNDYLLSYNWKGNIRELENLIERSVVLAKSDTLDFSNLIIGAENIENRNELINLDNLNDLSLKKNLEEFEKEFISKMIKRNNGSIIDAAQELKVNFSTLYRKMKKYLIE